MDKQKAKKEIEKLSKEIEEHNHRYYVLSDPKISDKEYDDLLKRLIKLEEKFPDLKKENSPSQRVGVKLPKGTKTVRHKKRMYSLDNTYSIDELREWEKRVRKGLPNKKIEYVVELKIDGVSISLLYEKGKLKIGATRGDGTTGEDVTHSIKTVGAVPLQMKKYKNRDWPDTIEVRGEVYLNIKEFEKINKERKKNDQSAFVNPRNAASGSLKLLDSRITAKRNLKCFAHSRGTLEGGKDFKDHWEYLQTVKHWGFLTNPHSKLCKSLDDVIKFCNEFQDKRDSLDYEVDGVVVKVNSVSQQERLGETAKSPRWAIAYKFPAQQATTKIKDIKVQVGRTGILTPVAELEPVFCGGVTISRSTLHNFDEIKRLKVKKGDRVLIERAGDVIPKIIKVVESSKGGKSKKVTIPKKCPVCKGPVVKAREENVAYRCNNPSCPRKLERSLIHFASRGAMDIDGMGESVVQQVLEKDFVKDLADIYALKKSQLMKMELFKDKKAENLLKSIEDSKDRPLSRLVFALGITNVGQKMARLLARRYGTMEKLAGASRSELNSIHEVGSVIAESVENFFKQKSTKSLLKKFEKNGVNMEEPESRLQSDKLKDKKFVFTGELDGYTRSQASDAVRSFGGEITSSVSKNTDFVVVGDSPGSKLEKARKLGVKTLNEKQFQEMINE